MLNRGGGAIDSLKLGGKRVREKRILIFEFFRSRSLLSLQKPPHASTSLHQLPQAVKYPQSSQLQHPSHHSKSRSSKPAEKASLATDPFVLLPPSLHSPPLPMTDNNLRILLSSDNHLGYNDKDPIRCNVCFAAFEEILMLARSIDAL